MTKCLHQFVTTNLEVFSHRLVFDDVDTIDDIGIEEHSYKKEHLNRHHNEYLRLDFSFNLLCYPAKVEEKYFFPTNN